MNEPRVISWPDHDTNTINERMWKGDKPGRRGGKEGEAYLDRRPRDNHILYALQQHEPARLALDLLADGLELHAQRGGRDAYDAPRCCKRAASNARKKTMRRSGGMAYWGWRPTRGGRRRGPTPGRGRPVRRQRTRAWRGVSLAAGGRCCGVRRGGSGGGGRGA